MLTLPAFPTKLHRPKSEEAQALQKSFMTRLRLLVAIHAVAYIEA